MESVHGAGLSSEQSQLLGVVLPVPAAVAGDDRAGGGHAGESGQADELPGDPHGRVAYAR